MQTLPIYAVEKSPSLRRFGADSLTIGGACHATRRTVDGAPLCDAAELGMKMNHARHQPMDSFPRAFQREEFGCGTVRV
jgi:hypothetical protein